MLPLLCYGHRAAKVVSDSRCSSNRRLPLISRLLNLHGCRSQTSALQNSVCCVYKSQLVSSEKKLLITLTWTISLVRKGFDVEFFDGETKSSQLCDSECSSYKVRRPKGYSLIDFNESKIELCWDISAAEYDCGGCEPSRKFHLMIAIDSELCLKLGETFNFEDDERMKTIATSRNVSSSVYFTRREKYFGNTFYATKAKFCNGGEMHDIVIKCEKDDDGSGAERPLLIVLVDGRKMVRVGNLNWNLRGSQAIFIDGLVVDMMWDVEDWLFKLGPGRSAIFLFRTRSGADSRLWFEEKNLYGDHLEFALVICGSRKHADVEYGF